MKNQSKHKHGIITNYVFQNDLGGLRAVMSQGADLNELDGDGRTPLIHAAIDNRLDIARLLLESGARANAQDDLGNSALHYAAQNFLPEMADLLLQHGAPIDAEDIHGNTPLWRAVFNSSGRGELILLLIKSGANPHRPNKHGKSPLDLARSIANYNVLKFFT